MVEIGGARAGVGVGRGCPSLAHPLAHLSQLIVTNDGSEEQREVGGQSDEGDKGQL